LQDLLGEKRETFPLTCYCVSGSQSEHGHLNHVIVMKMENLHRTTKEKKEETEEEDEESEEEEEEEDDEKQPELETALIKHNGAIVAPKKHKQIEKLFYNYNLILLS
jgi:ribosome assembly protein RRB1